MDHQVADVGQRVADRRHLPVQDRRQARRACGRRTSCCRAGSRRGRSWPAATRACWRPATRPTCVELRDLARAVDLPQAVEAPQLALEVAGRLAESLQPQRASSRRACSSTRRVDQLVGDVPAAARACRATAGIVLGDHGAADTLHDVERRADHLGVVADGQHPRGADRRRLKRRQQARLAQDVVGARGQRALAGGRRRTTSVDSAKVTLEWPSPTGTALRSAGASRPPAREELPQRLEHQQRLALVRRALGVGADDVVWGERCAHRCRESTGQAGTLRRRRSRVIRRRSGCGR